MNEIKDIKFISPHECEGFKKDICKDCTICYEIGIDPKTKARKKENNETKKWSDLGDPIEDLKRLYKDL